MEDIFKPIEDLRIEKEIRKAAKRVTTTRVVIYILAGLATFGILWSPDDVTTTLEGLLGILILLTPVFVSHKKPFIGMLIITIFISIASLVQTLDYVRTLSGGAPELVGYMLGQALVLWVMIRGTVNAKKLVTLQKQLSIA